MNRKPSSHTDTWKLTKHTTFKEDDKDVLNFLHLWKKVQCELPKSISTSELKEQILEEIFTLVEDELTERISIKDIIECPAFSKLLEKAIRLEVSNHEIIEIIESAQLSALKIILSESMRSIEFEEKEYKPTEILSNYLYTLHSKIDSKNSIDVYRIDNNAQIATWPIRVSHVNRVNRHITLIE